MPCFLGNYEGAAIDRREKLIRAIHSFNSQSYPNRELIIVADGCDETVEVGNQFNINGDIKVIKVPKQKLFSGNLRDEGVKSATGDIICYLDSDDVIGVNHLLTIVDDFYYTNKDWLYYNDYILTQIGAPAILKEVELTHGSIGTSSIAHKRNVYSKTKGIFGKNKITWKGCDGYGHDWKFIQKLMSHNLVHGKIYGCEYLICHIPSVLDN